MNPAAPDPEQLAALVRARMPFGKYVGRRLIELPEAYLLWFSQRGFPHGRLGQQLREVLELKTQGLDAVLYEVARRIDG